MDSPGANARIAAPEDAPEGASEGVPEDVPEDALEAALEAVMEDMALVAIAVSGGVGSMALAVRADGGPARRITDG